MRFHTLDGEDVEMHLGRKSRRVVRTVSIVGLALVAASCVGNPGPFTITFHEGSQLNLEDSAGNVTYVLDVGGIPCADGVDNDADGLVDNGVDPECDSAVDANERLDGVQAFTKGTQPVNVDANGNMTYEPTQMVSMQRELCFDTGAEVWCLGQTVKGVGGTRTGTVQAGAVNFPTTVKIELDALTGFAGLPADCEIGPIDATWVANNYDTTTGESHMVANDSPVPATTSCGDWNDGINAFLGLPTNGNAVMETTILNASGQPIQLS